jgi:hypothetical protein
MCFDLIDNSILFYFVTGALSFFFFKKGGAFPDAWWLVCCPQCPPSYSVIDTDVSGEVEQAMRDISQAVSRDASTMVGSACNNAVKYFVIMIKRTSYETRILYLYMYMMETHTHIHNPIKNRHIHTIYIYIYIYIRSTNSAGRCMHPGAGGLPIPPVQPGHRRRRLCGVSFAWGMANYNSGMLLYILACLCLWCWWW